MSPDTFADIMSGLDNVLIVVTTAEGHERAGCLVGLLRVSPGAGGVPVLEDIPHWVILRRIALLDEDGDHVCVTGEPVSAGSGGPFEPLRLSHVGHLQPGHGPRERPGPPSERAAPW